MWRSKRTFIIPLLLATAWMAPARAQEEARSVFTQAPATVADNPTFAAIAARLRQISVLRATFTQQKQIKALRRPLNSSGQFLFAPAYGVWWQTTTPFDTTFVMTPHGIMEQSEDAEPFTIEAEEQPIVMAFSKVFLSLFNGDTNELEERFELYFEGSEDRWLLGLKPKGHIMTRLIDDIILQGTEHIDVIYFKEHSDDLTVIRFAEITTQEPPLSEEEISRFAF